MSRARKSRRSAAFFIETDRQKETRHGPYRRLSDRAALTLLILVILWEGLS
jgi:hypothetical protein